MSNIPQYTEKIAKVICTSLFTYEPDIRYLETKIQNDLYLSKKDSQHLLYLAILKLNLHLFSPITKLELILTEGCNLACSYCFEKNMLGYKRMPLEVARAAIDLFFDYSADQTDLRITHFGGEPTLNFDAIQFVTEYAERKAIVHGKSLEFHMTSNGVLLNEEMVDYFARHKIKVLLSIDGMESTHNKYRKDKFGEGTFDKVRKGLEILKEKQVWIGSKMTVMPENVPNLFDDVMGLYNMGVNQFTIGHATGIKWSDNDIEEFAKQCGKIYRWYKEESPKDVKIDEFDELGSKPGYFGCQAGRNSISISVNGEISPCSKILGLNSKSLLAKLGDVQYGLTHMKNRSELVSCNKEIEAATRQGIDKDYLGGCFVSNYDENRDLFIPSIQEHNITFKKRAACAGCSCSNS